MESTLEKVLIVGASLGGQSAAVELRKPGYRGEIVDSHMRTSVPDIFAVGDVARFPSSYARGPKSDQSAERIRVEHWAVAIGHGQTAAKTICGLDEPYDDLPWFWSDQFDVTYNYSGHAPEWDELIWRGDAKTRKHSAHQPRN